MDHLHHAKALTPGELADRLALTSGAVTALVDRLERLGWARREPSGNRDERAFDAPDRFDIARDPNHHLGFGGGGPHFCMGSALAKLQLRSLFGQLLRRYPSLEVAEPTYLVGNFVNGVSALPMRRDGG